MTSSVSHLVANEVPLASLSLAPIDIDEIAPLPPPSLMRLSLTSTSGEQYTTTTKLSASKLRLLQDTTMIESALDLDSLEEASLSCISQQVDFSKKDFTSNNMTHTE